MKRSAHRTETHEILSDPMSPFIIQTCVFKAFYNKLIAILYMLFLHLSAVFVHTMTYVFLKKREISSIIKNTGDILKSQLLSMSQLLSFCKLNQIAKNDR